MKPEYKSPGRCRIIKINWFCPVFREKGEQYERLCIKKYGLLLR
jgi:hypothetical protein